MSLQQSISGILLRGATLLALGWCTVAPVAKSEQADLVVVVKSEHVLTLFHKGAVLRTYRVALGSGQGRKEQQGDNRTPEGSYRVNGHNAHSSCHLALHLSYPNSEDRARAAAAHRSPGGDVEIHGLPPAFSYLGSLHRLHDWTYGCVAVTDAEMDEIYKLVPDGTPVEIKP